MKALKKDLQALRKSLVSLTQQTEKIAMQSVIKSIRSITQQTERIAKKLDQLEKSIAKAPAKAAPKKRATQKKRPAKKAAARKPPAKKAKKKATATDTVLSIISRSKKGVDTATLRKKTGYDRNKIQIIIYRLKKRGMIKTVARGVYVKA